MKTKAILLIVLSLLCFNNVNAQKKKNAKITITGQVVDARQYPVSNAIIMVDGENTNSMTDANGHYKIKVRQTADMIGVVSFINGMIEEQINDRTVINLKYGGESTIPKVAGTSEGQEGEGAVSNGYGYKKEKDLTTPVKNIDSKEIRYKNYTSVYEIITREFAGVRVNGSNIIMHGSKDLFGDVPALLIVDGVPVNDFNGIAPAAVESISVLKGSSAAIYGSRGYGGAVVVTTKKGD